jgi:tetratricopeptide (TPR) repeat protein
LNRFLRKLTCCAVVVAAISHVAKADASSAGGANDLALAGLPEYCRHALTFGGTKEGFTYWEQRLGGTFHHMHHYCWALGHLRKATLDFKLSSGEKRHLYKVAVGDIDYVLGHAPDDYVLLPEILTRRGEALMRLKEFPAADASYARAIAARKDYWPAYIGYSDSLLAQGKHDRAIEVLSTGISQVADPRMLQRKLDELKRKGR